MGAAPGRGMADGDVEEELGISELNSEISDLKSQI
jgi:hypothetical protein